MERVRVSKLRENLMMFLKRVENGESIMITSHGHEVAKLSPLENRMAQAKKKLQQLGKNAIIGDILSPVGEDWEAMK